MSNIVRLVLLAGVACAVLFGAAFTTAQDPAQPAVETETRQALALASRVSHVSIDTKGFWGALAVSSIVAPGTLVKEGDVVAVVSAADYAEELQSAQAAAQAVRSRAAHLEFALKWEVKFRDVREQRAKLNMDTAVSALEHFLATGKTDRLAWAELNVQYNVDSIEDQEDELRQLEALYKGNDLAKESQDIVLKRAKRRLEQSRTRLKLAQNEYERIVKKDIPQDERNLRINAANATLEYESTLERGEQGVSDLLAHVVNARQDLDAAERRLNRLLEKQGRFELRAPHGGTVIHAGDAGADGVSAVFSPGSKVGNGQHLVSVLDTSTLSVTVGIDPRAVRLAQMKRNTAKVEVAELGISLEARVVAVSSVVRDDKVTVRLEVTPGESGLMHGQKVQVTLSSRK